MIHPSNISAIYREYMDSLYAYALHLGFREDKAMDAIHDVFYKLCIHNTSLDNITNLKFYLFRALKNRLIDMHRAERNYPQVIESEKEIAENIPFQLNVTIEDELINQEDQEKIRKQVESVLSGLTDRQRESIYLRYIHEYDYEEIAELMKISVPACRNLISKSLTKLKDAPLPLTQLLLIISNFPILVEK